MVDYFSLAVSHAVLLLAFWRLMQREDIDVEPPREDTGAASPAEAAPEPRKGMTWRA
jgi:hypothetical protein